MASETEESGKTPGTDLKEGVPTLPVLLARASSDPADDRLREPAGPRAHGPGRRRRPARRGAGPAAQAPGDGAGEGLRRRPGPGGQGPARRPARGVGAHRAGGLRRRGRGPHRLRPRPVTP
nr:hypothetical protein [Nocardioides convexus]